jgi:hypothetical protein
MLNTAPQERLTYRELAAQVGQLEGQVGKLTRWNYDLSAETRRLISKLQQARRHRNLSLERGRLLYETLGGLLEWIRGIYATYCPECSAVWDDERTPHREDCIIGKALEVRPYRPRRVPMERLPSLSRDSTYKA